MKKNKRKIKYNWIPGQARDDKKRKEWIPDQVEDDRGNREWIPDQVGDDKKARDDKNDSGLPASEGFTLIEILISLSILSIILGTITLFSVRTLQAYTRSKAMQNVIENSRFAIESLSKRLRTSHDVIFNNPNGSTYGTISFTDNVDSSLRSYTFNNNTLKDLSNNVLVGDEKVNVMGSFSGQYTVDPDPSVPASSDQRGYVTITIILTYNGTSTSPAEKDTVTIRSTVSLRDYEPPPD